jgi:hypothetical protein
VSRSSVFHDGYITPKALIHRYSVDHGATWFVPDTIASDLAGNLGVAPRVACVGGHGPIVVHDNTPGGTWWDATTVKVSRFSWPSFLPAVSLDTHRFEPGSLPGTVADRLSAPSIAVDRTPYLYSGRVYTAWVQSATLSPWPAAADVALDETEPNETPGAANPFGTSTGYLIGTMASARDADVFCRDVLSPSVLGVFVG